MDNNSYHQKENVYHNQRPNHAAIDPSQHSISPQVYKHNPGSPPTGQETKFPENPLQEVVNFMSRTTPNGKYNSQSTQGLNAREDPRVKKNHYN